ncbi:MULTISPECIES: LacI family DNA-binding transcriptional regulator [Paenibacillus]|uniref:LacI family DNA-binding transcriptional regulator n=1 Tax=Paenibacillus TaxID=44249 RepID=UPI0022B9313D|nr:LacI family DNA-binding transcriptional regulator [Paenibacillus caseinilyticus]MCZ8517918.1 LacI family DNA-binding transcriptional regulator [Paenibacillus caseinilyticus]
MNKEKITIQHIADSLGLSRNTVSKALNGGETIPAETRSRVIKRAIELKYKQFALMEPEAAASKPPGNIALFTANMPNSTHFGTSLISGMEKMISAEGFNLSIHIVRETELEALMLPVNFDRTKVDGIVCIELFDKPYTEFINTLQIPTICIDSPSDLSYPDIAADVLLMENEHSICRLTQALIDSGHRSLGFVGDIHHCRSFHERWTGFTKALAGAGLQLDPSLSITDADRLISNLSWLEERLNALHSLPSVFVCANDFIAINLMRILKHKQMRIPEDISVTGFDDSPEAQIVEPQLTTVHIYRDDMGIQAAEMLLSRIRSPHKPPQVTHVQTKPVFRGSTGDLPPQ